MAWHGTAEACYGVAWHAAVLHGTLCRHGMARHGVKSTQRGDVTQHRKAQRAAALSRLATAGRQLERQRYSGQPAQYRNPRALADPVVPSQTLEPPSTPPQPPKGRFVLVCAASRPPRVRTAQGLSVELPAPVLPGAWAPTFPHPLDTFQTLQTLQHH